MVYFTADNHFDHANIIKYCGRTLFMTEEDLIMYNKVKNLSREEQRKFMVSKESLQNMNLEQIRRWNEVVKKGDTVYQNGDFCLSRSSETPDAMKDPFNYYREQLNGNIIFIRGNHDKNNKNKTIIENLVINYGGERIFLTHNPVHANPSYKINLVGHIHTNWKVLALNNNSTMINVGVDVWDFRPITINEILSEYSKFKIKKESP
jgi:calcineurin-like phosphoesterase family protein